MRRLLYLVPLAIFAVLAVWMAVPLLDGRDPSLLPSALEDKPVPAVALPPLPGRDDGLALDDVVRLAADGPILVNFFASWCVPCLAEHPLLTRLAREDGISVVGIAYKDQPQDTLAWLTRNGDPFSRIGVDLDGRAGLEWGVYGVPETFVIDRTGNIRTRHAGPMTPDYVDRQLTPLLRDLAE